MYKKTLILLASALFISSFIPYASQEKPIALKKPALQMVVMSDVHMDKDYDTPSKKFQNALKDSLTIAPDYDAISIVGDLTDYGLTEEYDQFNQNMNGFAKKDAEKFISMGNHEYFEPIKNKNVSVTDKQLQQRFINKIQVPNIYYDKWINGYHFITLSSEQSPSTLKKQYSEHIAGNSAYISDTQFKWFEAKLAEKVEKNKPIFVFLHQPIANTVYGSNWGTELNTDRLMNLMKRYPQIIFFSGHSHYPLENSNSIVQNGITMVNTAAVKYGYDDAHGSMINMSEGYIVNVFTNRIELKARDYTNHKWIKTVNISLERGTWKKVNNHWYYYSPSGQMQKGWVYDYGKWYYLNSNGVMLTNWVLVNKKWYYLNPSGDMKTGWLLYKGSWYYLNNSGDMKTGWLLDKGKWFYLNSNGKMALGWLKDGGRWYYLKSDGSMAIGKLKIGKKYYYFSSSGAWIK